jgi:hypothetical protein
MMKKPTGILLFPLLFSIGFVATATTVIPPKFDDLVSRAQIIFEGEVTNLHSQWIGEGAQHRIVTFVTFKVDDVLKGDPGTSYSIRMLGGTVDGRTMQVTDAPQFKIGDHDVLFVENNGSQFIPLVGIQHGRFRVSKDASGREILTTDQGNPVTNVGLLGTPQEQTAQSAPAMSLSDFKAAVKNRISQLQASGKIR